MSLGKRNLDISNHSGHLRIPILDMQKKNGKKKLQGSNTDLILAQQ